MCLKDCLLAVLVVWAMETQSTAAQGAGAQGQGAADTPDIREDGSYGFRYQTRDQGGHYGEAVATPDNTVTGKFGYREPGTGRNLETRYTAGERGFRAQGPSVHRRQDLSQVKLPYNPPVPQDSPQYDPSYSTYHDPNEDSSYQFDFSTNEYKRTETGGPLGQVAGAYSYVDDAGDIHNVEFEAGSQTGFHVKSPHPDSNHNYNDLYFRGDGKVPLRGRTSIQRGLDGSYRFTTHSQDQRRSEVKDALGNTRGSYTYIDKDGVQRTVQYIAGPNIGYKIVNQGLGATLDPQFPYINQNYIPPVLLGGGGRPGDIGSGGDSNSPLFGSGGGGSGGAGSGGGGSGGGGLGGGGSTKPRPTSPPFGFDPSSSSSSKPSTGSGGFGQDKFGAGGGEGGSFGGGGSTLGGGDSSFGGGGSSFGGGGGGSSGGGGGSPFGGGESSTSGGGSSFGGGEGSGGDGSTFGGGSGSGGGVGGHFGGGGSSTGGGGSSFGPGGKPSSKPRPGTSCCTVGVPNTGFSESGNAGGPDKGSDSSQPGEPPYPPSGQKPPNGLKEPVFSTSGHQPSTDHGKPHKPSSSVDDFLSPTTGYPPPHAGFPEEDPHAQKPFQNPSFKPFTVEDNLFLQRPFSSLPRAGFYDRVDNLGKDRHTSFAGRPEYIDDYLDKDGAYSEDEFRGFPPGISVKGRVQSLDLNPFGTKVPAPGEALEHFHTERPERHS